MKKQTDSATPPIGSRTLKCSHFLVDEIILFLGVFPSCRQATPISLKVENVSFNEQRLQFPPRLNMKEILALVGDCIITSSKFLKNSH